MLECPGVFTMPLVLHGWSAAAVGANVFELEPPDKRAALHIAVYRRPTMELHVGEAEAHLKRFVDARPTEGEVRTVIVPAQPEQQRAFAKYLNRSDEGSLTEWLAACILWPTAMLMCSCNAEPGNPHLRDAELMIASIFPETAGRK